MLDKIASIENRYDELEQLLEEASIDYQRAEWAAYEKLAEEKVRAAGTIVVPIRDKGAWQALMAPLYARQSPEVRAVIERVRALR